MEKRTFGSFLTALRKANGLTQKNLADRLCVSDKAVSRWERDETFPDLSLLPVIADTFDVTVDELLRGEKAITEEGELPTSSGRRTELQVRKSIEVVLFRFTAAVLICIGSVIGAGVVRTFFYGMGTSETLYAVSEGIGFCVWLAALIFLIVYYMNCRNKLSGPEEYEKLTEKAKKQLLRRFRWSLILLIGLLPLMLMFLFELGWGAVVMSALIIGIPLIISSMDWLFDTGENDT